MTFPNQRIGRGRRNSNLIRRAPSNSVPNAHVGAMLLLMQSTGRINDTVQADNLPLAASKTTTQTGVVPALPNQQCVMISGGWPVWFFVMGTLNLTCDAWFGVRVAQLPLSLNPTPLPHMAASPTDSWVVISGSKSFIMPMWSTYSISHKLLVTLDAGSAPH